MRKSIAVLALIGLAAAAALGLASCGSGGSEGGGKEGGTLRVTYAEPPRLPGPAALLHAEGWTAMYDTYIPPAHLRARRRRGGQQGDPGPGGEPAQDQQRRQDLHAETSQGPQILRRNAGQGLRLHVRGRTPLQGQLGRLALLHEDRRRRKVRRNEAGWHPGHQDRRQDRRDRHRPGGAERHLRPSSSACCSSAPVPPDTPDKDQTPNPPPATGPYDDHQRRAGPRLVLRAQPLLGQGERAGDARLPRRARRQDRRDGHHATTRPRSTKSSRATTTGCRTRRRADRYAAAQGKVRGDASSASSRRSAPTTSG